MNQTIIDDFKNLTGAEDSLAISILTRAKMIILGETNRTKLLPEMEFLLIEVGLELYNKSGTEGEASRSQGGISVSYREDFSQHIIKHFNNFKLCRSGGRVFEKEQL